MMGSARAVVATMAPGSSQARRASAAALADLHRTGGMQQDEHRSRVVRLAAEHEPHRRHKGRGHAEVTPLRTPQAAHAGDPHGQRDGRGEHDELQQEPERRVVRAGGSAPTGEEVDARPPVPHLPPEVRERGGDDDGGGDHRARRNQASTSGPRADEPDGESGHQDAHRVLGGPRGGDGRAQRDPTRAITSRPESNRCPQHQCPGQLVERDGLEHGVGAERHREDSEHGEHLGPSPTTEIADDGRRHQQRRRSCDRRDQAKGHQ